MRYTWIDEYLLKKRGVTKDLQESWNWIRYHVGGKMFAAICLDDQNTPYYINLKILYFLSRNLNKIFRNVSII